MKYLPEHKDVQSAFSTKYLEVGMRKKLESLIVLLSGSSSHIHLLCVVEQ